MVIYLIGVVIYCKLMLDQYNHVRPIKPLEKRLKMNEDDYAI